jgi:hypothetical protein
MVLAAGFRDTTEIASVSSFDPTISPRGCVEYSVSASVEATLTHL